MAKEYYTTIANAPRTLYITARDDEIVRISTKKPLAIGVRRQDNLPILTEASLQLTRYFDGKDTALTFPVPDNQPLFIRKVYASIAAVPYGETRSVSHIARMTGNERATESVRMLCRFTPLIVRIPVHRVIDVYESESADTFGAALRQLEQRYC